MAAVLCPRPGHQLPIFLSIRLASPGLFSFVLEKDQGACMAAQPQNPGVSSSKSGRSATSLWEMLKMTYSDWSEDKATRLGAALAYYTVFSLAPLLIIVLAIAGAVFDPETVRAQINQQLGLGEAGGEGIARLIEGAQKSGSGLVASILGGAAILFGATGVFVQLKDALNTIWEVEPKPGLGVWAYVKERLLSFGMILVIGFLLLVLLVVSAVLHGVQEYIGEWLPMPGWTAQLLDVVISFAGVTLLFAMIYKYLPDVQIRWRDVWLGAAVTALLFTVGKFLLGLYLGRASFTSAYGAAGTIVIILLWAYYSAQILFFGAEFTQVYAKQYGGRIRPAENARAVTGESRARQGLPHRGKASPTG
jgi:membrane protein